MKLGLKLGCYDGEHFIELIVDGHPVSMTTTNLDDIEDLEGQLLDLEIQLGKYRKEHQNV